ncbi:MarR family winged helix-turn-helix transcriptional regulator [Saccharopolyspora hordei]|uniref:DNA-binding MarR family transcriptional regulator n=1 Tax=Saccharopolyspora hordei TaxID=1838 RepID=A0A853ASE4_9PSEU|nr:MarR family transcriptional regulator [Saccharopolyspora hordei]NYI84887.1 DNA-binding MarR family transcriptional regulator [Saccharopolyspora hordei]
MSRHDPETETTTGVADAAADVRNGVMRLARRLRAERDPGELTLGRLAVLGRLERDGPATTSALAVAERVTPQSMARIVQHLISAGLAERAPDPDDRRAAIVRITDAGREQVQQDRQRREAWLARAMSELSDVERDLLVLAARLLDRLADS